MILDKSGLLNKKVNGFNALKIETYLLYLIVNSVIISLLLPLHDKYWILFII